MSSTPKIIDNDRDEITATLGGKEIRGWSYKDETERRVKMKCAHEFAEGWFQRDKQAKPKEYDASKVDLKYSQYFGFDDGGLTIKQQGYGDADGSGYFTFNEDVLDWKNDEGREYAVIKIKNDELIFIRDHLNTLFPNT